MLLIAWLLFLLYPAPKDAQPQPITPDMVRPGDVVWMVWPYSSTPIKATVFANDRNGFRRFSSDYGLEWPDEFEGGTKWTPWDSNVKVFATDLRKECE